MATLAVILLGWISLDRLGTDLLPDLQSPVVTTDLRECRRYPGVLVSCDSKQYVENLRRAPALLEDVGYRSVLDETARSNTWESRVETIMTALAAVTPGRGDARRSG